MKIQKSLVIITLIIFFLPAFSFSQTNVKGGFDTGGGKKQSANYGLKDSSGQMVAGKSQSANYGVSSGSIKPLPAILYALLFLPDVSLILNGKVDITGTALNTFTSYFKDYQLVYGKGSVPANWLAITSDTKAKKEELLGNWDTSLLAGTFTVKLIANSTNGNNKQITKTFEISNDSQANINFSPQWQMVSLPLSVNDSENNLTTLLSGLADYKIYFWDPANPGNEEFLQFVVPQKIIAGRSYWVKAALPQQVVLKGKLVRQTENFVVPVLKGWNQIADPFIYPIDWGATKVSYNGSESTIANSSSVVDGLVHSFGSTTDSAGNQVIGYTAQTIDSGVLKPVAGYFVYAKDNCNLVLSSDASNKPTTVKSKKLIASADTENKNVQINLSAKVGNYIDADNFLGTINKSKSKEDLSAFEPPALENNISLYFNSNGNKYSSLFQDANSAAKIWEFEVKTGIKKEDVIISWDNVSIPGDEIAVLVDVQNNTTIDMTDTDKYVYNSGQGGTRKFLVKEGSYIDIAKTLNLQISRVLVLPNPVKQTASGKDKAKLLIDVSSGYPVETEVQLFNTSGQTIKSFVSSPIMLAKGKFKFSSPDFENVADALPNGVYLLKVTLSNDSNKVSKVLKMAVVK